MNKKRLCRISALAMALLLTVPFAAACGNGSKDNTDPPSGVVTPPDDPVTPPDDPVTPPDDPVTPPDDPVTPPDDSDDYKKDDPAATANAVTYNFVISGLEGGPAISKTVIKFGGLVDGSTVANDTFNVSYEATNAWTGGTTVNTLGGATQKAYLSDKNGDKVTESQSRYVTIEYELKYIDLFGFMSSIDGNLSPFTYANNLNSWNDLSTYKLNVGTGKSFTVRGNSYTSFESAVYGEKLIPCMKDWRTDGKFTDGSIKLTYGAYEPEALTKDGGKNALIIWLHGAGEGGTDPSVAILGNQVTGLSDENIQKHFKKDGLAGAYVLAPQTPTMWMDNGDGQQGGNETKSIYTDSLLKLIKQYVTEHSDIDANRIYLGGCSNGGYMTMDLLLKDPSYFAAAYPIATPYTATPAQLATIKDIPIWFTHAKADTTVSITADNNFSKVNTNQLYIDLLAAGAKNVYYSLYEKVVSMTKDVNHMGHWSWCYTLKDDCKYVQASTGASGAFGLSDLNVNSKLTVKVDGKDVTIFEWIAAQKKA